MEGFMVKIKQLSKKKSIKLGVPFFTLVVGASFVLKQFTNLRYEYSQKSLMTEEERRDIGMKKPGEVTLESEYEKIKETDIDSWKQVRIPRPYDENEVN